MSVVLERFENVLQSHAGPRGAAIDAAARKHPVGFSQWVKKHVAGMPNTAGGFDQARGKLETLGLTRGQAMKQTARVLPDAHLAWLRDYNSKHSQKSRDQEAPAAALAVARHSSPGSTARGGAAYIAALARYQSEGLTRAQAIRRAQRDEPESHQAWVVEQARGAAVSAPSLDSSPPVRPVQPPIQTPATPPAVIAESLPAASDRQPGARQGLNAEELAALRERWDKFPALRAVHGDDFALMLAHREGRVTFDEVRSLREATASKQSREMWKTWDTSPKRVF